MSGHVQLILSFDLARSQPAYRVALEEADSYTPKANGVLTAVSPLFPATPSSPIPKAEDSYTMVFLVHRNAFVQLGTLEHEVLQYFWYSLGIATLVAIIPAGAPAEKILGAIAADDILCRETWTIENGLMATAPRVEVFPNEDARSFGDLSVPKIDDPDFRRIVNELRLNFDSLRQRASLLMPSLASAAEKMWAQIAREIEVVAEGIVRVDPTAVADGINERVQRYLVQHKKLNLSIDYIIQLNSSFAYILSQCFYGGPPLTRNLSLISSNSLLGIGTAMKALQRLTDFVIEGFADHPVAHVVKVGYTGTSLALYLRPENAHEGHVSTIDAFLPQYPPAAQTPKLAYFSTRMGFSEQGYCVTASTQCLASACAARRNMLTITHELLHAHVKGLLATILARPVASVEMDAGLFQLTREYRKCVEDVAADPSCVLQWPVIKFVRFRMFVFADGMQALVAEYPGCVVSDESSASIDAGPLEDDYFEAERFKNSFGFLNELVVHILDLHYFYDAAPHTYLATLWKSWATVPGVADKIEWYILRCLAAISVINLHGLTRDGYGDLTQHQPAQETTVDQQFAEAIGTLGDVLDELCEAGDAAPMLHVVADRLKDPPTRQWLRYAFFPCHLFAQVVKQFVYSPVLREYFGSFKDPLADRDDQGEPIYRLSPFEFSTQPIRNPIALLRSLLRRELTGSNPADEEAASAWLFLALSSVPETE